MELLLLNWLLASAVVAFSSAGVTFAKSSKLELMTSSLLSSIVGEETSGGDWVVDVEVVRRTLVLVRLLTTCSLVAGVVLELVSLSEFRLRVRLYVLLESNRSLRPG